MGILPRADDISDEEVYGLKQIHSEFAHTKFYFILITVVILQIYFVLYNPMPDKVPSIVWALFFSLIIEPVMAIWYITKYVLWFRSKKFRAGNIEFTTVHGDSFVGYVDPVADKDGFTVHERLRIDRVGGLTDFFFKGHHFAIYPDNPTIVKDRTNVTEIDGDFAAYDWTELPPWIRQKFIAGSKIITPGFKKKKSIFYVAYDTLKEDGVQTVVEFDPHRMIRMLDKMLTHDEYYMAQREFVARGVQPPGRETYETEEESMVR
jgi:hypothetical protein